jgi:hypothetical protein
MSEHGSFISNKTDAANIHITRDMHDEARARDFGHDNPAFIESERIADAYDRREREARMKQFREDNLRANRWGAFQTTISRLQLTPEQITARVAELFSVPAQPTPAQVEEEVATASLAEDSAE